MYSSKSSSSCVATTVLTLTLLFWYDSSPSESDWSGLKAFPIVVPTLKSGLVIGRCGLPCAAGAGSNRSANLLCRPLCCGVGIYFSSDAKFKRAVYYCQ